MARVRVRVRVPIAGFVALVVSEIPREGLDPGGEGASLGTAAP